ncbi:MAG: hypothetical protein OXB84_01140 [Halobacteriovoraceae bacterium]|nr:hypothetical protein [Halobacteriovoraceae bacterium]
MTFDDFRTSASSHIEVTFPEEHDDSGETQTLLDQEEQSYFINPLIPLLYNTEKRWEVYLKNIPNNSEGVLNAEYVNLLKQIRQKLHDVVGYMPPPNVVEGEDGGLQLIWEKSNLYLAIDVISYKNIEWFLKDLKTKKYWGDEEIALSDFPSEELQGKLKIWKKH